MTWVSLSHLEYRIINNTYQSKTKTDVKTGQKAREKGGRYIPHEINPQMDAEFDEKLVHLANISGISMGVEEGGGGHRMPDVNGHGLCAAAGGQPENVDVLAVRKGVQEQKASCTFSN